jgi:cytochrome P450
MLADADLVPFEPPAKPLGLAGLITLWRNYIETIPRSAYEEAATRIQTRLADTLLISDPELIQEILVEKVDRFGRDSATRRSFAPVIGTTSLFLAEGADWRWQRRAVAPLFRHDTLLSFVPIIATMAERQVERWRTAQPGAPVDAAAAMTRTTFDIIVEAILGGSESLDAERYSRAVTEYFETIPWHLLYGIFSLPEWMPYPGRRRGLRARDFLHRDIGRIVAARRAKPASRSDLLELLLTARDPETGRSMSDAEVVYNLLTFVVAGHETTAVALAWTLWLIAKDQAVQQRLYDEAMAVAGLGAITAGHVESLSFSRQVIQEAMRLFPPVPGLAREPKAAMDLGGIEITPRTNIHIPIYALHRNTRLWHHPNAFDPDRFAPAQVKAHPRHAFLPFGGGPRVCIGSGFAMIEAAVILATLVRPFRFRPAPGYRPHPVAKLSLRPAGGMPLLVTPR